MIQPAGIDDPGAIPGMLRILAALVLALPIGWERERASRSAGLRTFPLVAAASCAYVVVALDALGRDPEAQSRIIQGLMTGIGFVGGGAILKSDERVRGTATAASIWMTGALGAAVAHRRYGAAILISVITFLTLRVLTAVERRLDAAGEPGAPPEK